MDRSNIGNAKVGGMEDDLALTDTMYSVIVLVFFTSYLVCEVPSNMILNRVRPSMYLPLLGVLWGIVATCMGAAQNYGQLVAMRFLLGVFVRAHSKQNLAASTYADRHHRRPASRQAALSTSPAGPYQTIHCLMWRY